ncbi:isoleucine--tRNA ligase [Sandarakinorhabdus cyanobacteriorum]|uniref:Isoleucine--tRNA ligase n=1 Tax=Sandarakinorhabdus cyanobacteriorum TaxID=1981098 RepID=A0A255YLK4_9SPHN|nr:isoleucine--tRNA ligase [Sandarakinorhabdus cyanobacteriorum]OYQ30152.1 isoleucine--tRNA ligase [Sandarakinorhabdus cyanobacteriorum]
MSAPDYRPTVFLPKTDFPMKAGLPEKEPQILAKWQAADLYAQLRAARKGRDKFIYHDGPPYANGDMHIGHALNHILKDAVVRTQSLLGKDVPYVPGWDCHGLPIEWKVEEAYRAKKQNKDEVPAKEFRAECRAYAQHWVNVQAGQLQRLGINGDWKKPYLTMDFASEATIVSELLKFAESGQLYRGAKPVMWSPVEKTALADAEVEYHDITSTQIDVAFEIVEAPNAPELVGAYAVIWTTTPWTIPVNQGIAYSEDVDYICVEHLHPELIQSSQPGQAPAAGKSLKERTKRVIVAAALLEQIAKERMPLGLKTDRVLWRGKGADFAGAVARHPMHKLGGFFATPRPFLPGDFVTTDQGTGLVHMAPDHGEDDFALCKAHGINPVFAVEADGRYRADWLWLGGEAKNVINPNLNAPDGPICSDLKAAGALLSAGPFAHSYPHSWRSKKKVIFRCTPQWFVPMDKPIGPSVALRAPPPHPKNGEDVAVPPQAPLGEGDHAQHGGGADTLRARALAAIAATHFTPDKGRNRIGSMVEGRPDWVLSRQRAWGVPITLFVDRKTGDYLVDKSINQKIIERFKAEGVDAWTPEFARELLGDRVDQYEMITDILDVWFDSGCTHAYVLESGRWPEYSWPADLYLEGSDQHRGWFQSSLLQSCATRGRAPYKAILTHGFTMDASGRKMSKSEGNVINPLDVMKTFGADILRLWALSVDFTEDHRIGDEILKGVADQYRKLRNTFRYLLGALDGFSDAERLPVAEMPALERWVLHRLAVLSGELKAAVNAYDFNRYTSLINDFVQNDLSAFAMDVRKDSLYCDAPTAPTRRAWRTVLDIVFHALTRWLAPVLVFTAEEVWATRYPDAQSVHLLEWPEIDAAWQDAALDKQFTLARKLREEAYLKLEELRRARKVGSFLEARVAITTAHSDRIAALAGLDLAELLLVAEVAITAGDTESLMVEKADLAKCARCWRHLPDVNAETELCGRCDAVVHG